jgi:hypothetical protein
MSSRIKGLIDAVSDLAMDYQSRMARANDIDIDTRAQKYHGTNNLEGFEQFDPLMTGKGADQYGPGFYLSTSPNQASGFADGMFRGRGLPAPDSPGVLPLYSRTNNLMEVDGRSANHLGDVLNLKESQVRGMLDQSSALKRSVDNEDMNPLGDYYESFWSEGADDWMLDDLAAQYAGRNPEELTDLFADNGEFLAALSDATGFDGLNVKFSDDLANEIHWKPENIRSTSAQFDPTKKDSANLLAGVTGAGLLGGSMFASEDADAGILSRIKAFHGSPHDFDKFSTENIGTGEGAQAYGHGLYFAEREGTAKSYRDALSDSSRFNPKMEGGDSIPTWISREITKDGVESARSRLKKRLDHIEKMKANPDYKYVIQDTNAGKLAVESDHHVNVWAVEEQERAAKNAALQLDRIENGEKIVNPGHMYEVDIDASLDELLDYDLPLNTQSPKIQKSIDDIMKSMGVESYVRDGGDGAETIYIGTGLGGLNTGSQILNNLSGKRGPVGASQMLKEAGVKGIKYADAQTRFSPKGRTNNYVMFDDETISIARKYGVTMPVAAAILAGTVTPQDAQASTKPEGKGLLDSIGDTALETMSGVNRAAADGVNFLTSDQINAILNLSGSDKRIPDLYDIPGVESGTKGNYMEPGLLRQIVRQGSEFLSPI